LRYLSLFSGIAASTLAWRPLGWQTAGYADIEGFPNTVRSHHWPEVPNLGDVTAITEQQIADLGPLDLVVFGSPCQDLSIAGRRAGLQGERSGLFFTAIRIVEWARQHCGCRFALWENVPGAFSSNKGRDFAEVVGAMAGIANVDIPPKGWGNEGVALGDKGLVEWAVLDAQWFGVAQRRRRVFALADFGDWAGRPPILLEPEGLRGDSAPRRQAGQGVAGTITKSLERCSADDAERGTLIRSGVAHAPDIARCVATREGSSLDYETTTTMIAHALRAEGFDASEDGTGRGTPLVPVGFAQNQRDEVRLMDVCGALASEPGMKQTTYAFQDMQVRRLTPRECERLQGMPDDHTQVPNRSKPAADGPRYKALGNSAAVPVLRWIGERIDSFINLV
jgi:DNA (cytosine-5)-methyltransferase 1